MSEYAKTIEMRGTGMAHRMQRQVQTVLTTRAKVGRVAFLVAMLMTAMAGSNLRSAADELCNPVIPKVYSFRVQDQCILWQFQLPQGENRAARDYVLVLKPRSGTCHLYRTALRLPRGISAVTVPIPEDLEDGFYAVHILEQAALTPEIEQNYLGSLVVKNQRRYLTFIPRDAAFSAFPPELQSFTDEQKEQQREAGRRLRAALKQAVLAGEERFLLAPGYYRLGRDVIEAEENEWPTAILKLKNAKNLRIDGQGATILLENPSRRGIVLDGCTNCSITNLTIDYDPLPWLQGMVISVDEARHVVRLRLDPGFEESALALKVTVDKIPLYFHAFLPSEMDGRILQPDWVAGSTDSKPLIPLGNREYEVNFHSRFIAKGEEQPIRRSGLSVGDAVALVPRAGNNVLEFLRCAGTNLSDLRIYASAHFAVFDQMPLTRSQYKNLIVMRRPNTRRLLSCAADGLHFKWHKDGPWVLNCVLEGTMDDAISMSGISVLSLKEAERTRTLVVAPRDDSMPTGIRVGDPVEIYAYRTLLPAGTARITDMKKITERETIAELKELVPSIKPKLGLVHYAPQTFYRLTLDREVTTEAYSLVMTPATCAADGFRFEGCYIYNNWATSIRATGVNGTIRDNTLECSGQLQIAPSLNWLNGIFPARIQILNNRILDGRDRICLRVSGDLWSPPGTPSRLRLHDIEIAGNVIRNARSCGVAVGDIEGLSIHNNELTNCNTQQWLPSTSNELESGIDCNYGIVVQNCKNGTLYENSCKAPGAFMKAPVNCPDTQ